MPVLATQTFIIASYNPGTHQVLGLLSNFRTFALLHKLSQTVSSPRSDIWEVLSHPSPTSQSVGDRLTFWYSPPFIIPSPWLGAGPVTCFKLIKYDKRDGMSLPRSHCIRLECLFCWETDFLAGFVEGSSHIGGPSGKELLAGCGWWPLPKSQHETECSQPPHTFRSDPCTAEPLDGEAALTDTFLNLTEDLVKPCLSSWATRMKTDLWIDLSW